MLRDPARPVSPTATWFFRIVGPALLASSVIGYFFADSAGQGFDMLVGPLDLVAWVGSFLVFLDHRRSHPKFALPFALIVVAIVLLAFASLVPLLPDAVPAQARSYFADGARIAHVLAALAFTVVGWTTRPLSRR
jgi:hypothetical protein